MAAAAFSRILVPLDFSTTSDAALGYAKMLAANFGASLHLLHVLENPITSGAWSSEAFIADVPRLRESIREDADLRLRALITSAERTLFRATFEIIAGRPAREIVACATDNHMDLIVMGTHGRSGLAHLLLGSVAERTVRTAPCPVLTVRTVSVPLGEGVKSADVAVAPPAFG